MSLTPAQITKFLNRGHGRGRNKFGAVRCEADGIKFDSKAERARYTVLKLREAAGEVRDLQVHVPFVLHVAGVKIGKYVADFVYLERGEKVVEDVKGGNATRTALSRWKIKHMEAEHGVKVRIVT